MPQNQNQEKIKCQTRNEIYIGKTERILAHRINEHNSKNKNIESAIQSHKKENPIHIIDASVIQIIDKADNNFKLMLKEMLHIIKIKPMLSTQQLLRKEITNRCLYSS